MPFTAMGSLICTEGQGNSSLSGCDNATPSKAVECTLEACAPRRKAGRQGQIKIGRFPQRQNAVGVVVEMPSGQVSRACF